MYLYVTPFHCHPKPEMCRLKPVTCRPAQEHSHHKPVRDCRPEPPCAVTDLPKRAYWIVALASSNMELLFMHICTKRSFVGLYSLWFISVAGFCYF